MERPRDITTATAVADWGKIAAHHETLLAKGFDAYVAYIDTLRRAFGPRNTYREQISGTILEAGQLYRFYLPVVVDSHIAVGGMHELRGLIDRTGPENVVRVANYALWQIVCDLYQDADPNVVRVSPRELPEDDEIPAMVIDRIRAILEEDGGEDELEGVVKGDKLARVYLFSQDSEGDHTYTRPDDTSLSISTSLQELVREIDLQDAKAQLRTGSFHSDPDRDTIIQFLAHASHGILTWAQEQALGKFILAGQLSREDHELGTDEKQAKVDADYARQILITHNIRLVVYCLRRFRNRGVETPDLLQEGVLGLDRAARKFDYRRGFRFNTYAFWWIKNFMSKAIKRQKRSSNLSLDKPLSPSSTTHTGADILPDARAAVDLEDAERAADDSTRHEFVKTLIERWVPDMTARNILDMRWGLSSGRPMSLDEIALQLPGASRETYRKKEEVARQQIRRGPIVEALILPLGLAPDQQRALVDHFMLIRKGGGQARLASSALIRALQELNNTMRERIVSAISIICADREDPRTQRALLRRFGVNVQEAPAVGSKDQIGCPVGEFYKLEAQVLERLTDVNLRDQVDSFF